MYDQYFVESEIDDSFSYDYTPNGMPDIIQSLYTDAGKGNWLCEAPLITFTPVLRMARHTHMNLSYIYIIDFSCVTHWRKQVRATSDRHGLFGYSLQQEGSQRNCHRHQQLPDSVCTKGSYRIGTASSLCTMGTTWFTNVAFLYLKDQGSVPYILYKDENTTYKNYVDVIVSTAMVSKIMHERL